MEPAWYKYRSLDAISMQAYFLQILMLLLMAGQNLYRGCAYLKNKSEVRLDSTDSEQWISTTLKILRLSWIFFAFQKYSSVMSRFADMLLVFCFLTTLLFTLPQKHDKDATIQDRCWVMLGYLCVEVLIQLVLFCLKQEEDLKPKPCGDGCTCGRHPEPEPEPTAALNETIGILNTNVDDDTSDVEAPPPSYEECMASAGSGRRVGGQRCCV